METYTATPPAVFGAFFRVPPKHELDLYDVITLLNDLGDGQKHRKAEPCLGALAHYFLWSTSAYCGVRNSFVEYLARGVTDALSSSSANGAPLAGKQRTFVTEALRYFRILYATSLQTEAGRGWLAGAPLRVLLRATSSEHGVAPEAEEVLLHFVECLHGLTAATTASPAASCDQQPPSSDADDDARSVASGGGLEEAKAAEEEEGLQQCEGDEQRAGRTQLPACHDPWVYRAFSDNFDELCCALAEASRQAQPALLAAVKAVVRCTPPEGFGGRVHSLVCAVQRLADRDARGEADMIACLKHWVAAKLA